MTGTLQAVPLGREIRMKHTSAQESSLGHADSTGGRTDKSFWERSRAILCGLIQQDVGKAVSGSVSDSEGTGKLTAGVYTHSTETQQGLAPEQGGSQVSPIGTGSGCGGFLPKVTAASASRRRSFVIICTCVCRLKVLLQQARKQNLPSRAEAFILLRT